MYREGHDGDGKHGSPKGVFFLFRQQGDLVGVVGFLKLWRYFKQLVTDFICGNNTIDES